MCDVICDEPSLLQMISRFGIPLGVGDQTVRQVCEAHGVDTLTFLSVKWEQKNSVPEQR